MIIWYQCFLNNKKIKWLVTKFGGSWTKNGGDYWLLIINSQAMVRQGPTTEKKKKKKKKKLIHFNLVLQPMKETMEFH